MISQQYIEPRLGALITEWETVGLGGKIYSEICAIVKAAVIGVGRIGTPEVAEEILAKGRVDLVGLGRQLLADPFWPRKGQEGRAQEIVRCDACNLHCWIAYRSKHLPADAPLCKLNERAGKESEIPAPE